MTVPHAWSKVDCIKGELEEWEFLHIWLDFDFDGWKLSESGRGKQLISDVLREQSGLSGENR